jgi:hypothetical protein
MAAYKNNKDGHKLWLIENVYGGWVCQFRPDKTYVDQIMQGRYSEVPIDTHIYSIKVKEIERKKLFTVKATELGY